MWLGNAQDPDDELMEAGVTIYEYRPTFIHSKFMVVDGRWSGIGSPNFNTFLKVIQLLARGLDQQS